MTASILKLKETLKRLLTLHSSPHEIALGIAAGVFIGFTPFYGFHTLLMIAAAFLIRPANKIAILIGTNVSLPPTFPLITWAGYETGRWVLGSRYPALDLSLFENLSYNAILAKIIDIYYPLLIGSLILGGIFALVFYLLVRVAVQVHQSKRQKVQPGNP